MTARTRIGRTGALALGAALAAQGATAQTPVGSNIDSRLVAAFDVDDAALQAWMPDGWTATPIPGGPLAGGDLLTVMIDQHVARDADGADLAPPTALRMALAALATDGSETRLFVLRIYTDPDGADPYGNSAPATIARTATRAAPAGGPRTASQTWTVAPQTGGTLTLSVSHAPGMPSWGPGEARPYSAADPDFSRLYSFSQLVDLAMSEALGRPLDGAATLESDVPELAAMFDGNQRLVGVLDIPLYVREVALPRDRSKAPRRIP